MARFSCILFILLTTLACSNSDSSNNDIPSEPDQEIPDQNSDPNPPLNPDPDPQEPSYKYPYGVTVLSTSSGNVIQADFDMNGELVANHDLKLELNLPTNSPIGSLLLDAPHFAFFKDSPPTLLAAKNIKTAKVWPTKPFCDPSTDYYVNNSFFTTNYGAVFLHENGTARIDVYDYEMDSCQTIRVPEIENFYLGHINGQTLILHTTDLNQIQKLYFIDLSDMQLYNSLELQSSFSSLTVNGDKLLIFGEYTYEIRDLGTLELLKASTEIEVLIPSGPFLNTNFFEDKMQYETVAAGAGLFAKLPVIYNFTEDKLYFPNFYDLYNNFIDEYFENNGEIPYGFDFKHYEINLETNDVVIGFSYTKDQSGSTDFEGGLLFTNFFSEESDYYFIEIPPSKIIITE